MTSAPVHQVGALAAEAAERPSVARLVLGMSSVVARPLACLVLLVYGWQAVGLSLLGGAYNARPSPLNGLHSQLQARLAWGCALLLAATVFVGAQGRTAAAGWGVASAVLVLDRCAAAATLRGCRFDKLTTRTSSSVLQWERYELRCYAFYKTERPAAAGERRRRRTVRARGRRCCGGGSAC